jgi:alanyl aminopeptidase
MTRAIGSALAAMTLAFLAACTPSAGKPGADGRLPVGVTPLRYDLALTIDPRQERFSGEAKIALKFDKPTRVFWLHGRDIKVSAASLTAGAKTIGATYTENGEGAAAVRLASTAPAGEAILTIVYDAPFNDSAAGLYHSESGGEKYAVTQFEALDARRAFPSFDQPNYKTPFAVSIVARAGDTVIANTARTGAEPAGEGLVRHTFLETKPLPTYLVAFAVGPYDVIDGPVLPKTAQREAVQLRGVAVKGKGAQTRYALSITADLMRYFEDYFDTPYPYDKLDFIAAPEFSAGAMENAGAIVYAEQAILMGADAPVDQQRNIVTTHAHEIAHQWFGDLVTPAWWDDIWLNEAFATWMSYKAAKAVFPDGGYEREMQLRAIAAMDEDSLSSARRIREPIVTESDVEDAFDAITYSKGGGVLAMAESYLGEDAFREGVRTHMRRFPHGVATSKDFFESLGQGAQRPEIVDALASFTDRNHVPLIETRLDCPTDGGRPRVRLSQDAFEPVGVSLERRTWTAPVCVAAYGLTGAGDKTCAILSTAEGDAALGGVCPAFVAPNAGGAGYYRFALDERGWTTLVAGFRRLDPGGQIASLDSLYASFAANKVSAALLLRGLEAGAGAADLSVRRQAIGLARKLADVPATDAARDAYAAWIRATFAVAAVSRRSSAAERQMAASATRLLALYGDDANVRARLLAAARGTVGLARTAPASLDDRAVALIVGVQEGGPTFFNALLKKAKESSDAQFQSEALGALAHAPGAEERAAFAEAVLGEQFTGSQMRRALFRTQEYPESAAVGLQVLREHFDAVAARMPGGLAGQSAPKFANAVCTPEERDALDAIFRQNGAKAPGHERALNQARETIDRCIALRAARGGELATALNATD